MSRPLVLVRLICPERCFLGAVVAGNPEPAVVLNERAYVQSTLEAGEHTAHPVGPYPLTEVVTYGCRHGHDVLDAEQRKVLLRKVDQIRCGERKPGTRHVLRRGSGIVA